MEIDKKDALYIQDMVHNIRNTLSHKKYEDYESFDSIDEIFASCNDIMVELERFYPLTK